MLLQFDVTAAVHNTETPAFPLKCYTVLKLEIVGTVSLDYQSLPPMSQHALTFFLICFAFERVFNSVELFRFPSKNKYNSLHCL